MLDKITWDEFIDAENKYNFYYEKIKERAIEIGLELQLISEKDSGNIDDIFHDKDQENKELIYVNYSYYCGEWTSDQFRFPIEYLWSDELLLKEKERQKEIEDERKKLEKEMKKKKEEEQENITYQNYLILRKKYEGK
jgi:hypothetical protein